MRFFLPLVAAFAAAVVAQSSSGSATVPALSSAASTASTPANTAGACSAPNCFDTPAGGYQITAGVPITLTWGMTSSGTKNIYLTQGGSVAAGSGILLLAGIPASATSATVTVPANVNFSQYNFEIIDQSNPSLINFSAPFTVQGATGVTSSSSGSMSSTATGSSTSSSGSSASSSASRSASSSSASASSSMSSASHSASSASSSASTSATAAPASSGVTFGVNGVLAMIAAAVAFF